MVWNYRGYGRTQGTNSYNERLNYPSPEHIKSDSEAVLSYLRETIGVKGKIGVYGRSLGGIAATHLTKYVDMIICDRTFGNLHSVAETKFYGRIAQTLFNLTTGWRTTNDVDLTTRDRENKFGLQYQNCYKVVTCDKNDEIIDVHSSLPVLAAHHWFVSNGVAPLLTAAEC